MICHVLSQENLVEQKHHKLARSLRSGPVNRELKPNAATRDQLNVSDMSFEPVRFVVVLFVKMQWICSIFSVCYSYVAHVLKRYIDLISYVTVTIAKWKDAS